MIQKEFQSNKIKAIITQFNQFIPIKLRKLHFSINKDVLLLEFFDIDNINITDVLVSTMLNNEQTLYISIYTLIKPIVINLEQNVLYFFSVKKYNVRFFALGKSPFIEQRHKKNLSINQLSNQANVNLHIIYSLENGENKNYTIDTIIKYILFFQKPLFYFISKKYKKEFVTITANELANNNLITETQRENIIAFYV